MPPGASNPLTPPRIGSATTPVCWSLTDGGCPSRGLPDPLPSAPAGEIVGRDLPCTADDMVITERVLPTLVKTPGLRVKLLPCRGSL